MSGRKISATGIVQLSFKLFFLFLDQWLVSGFTKDYCLTEWAYIQAVTRLWNDLPNHVVESVRLQNFKCGADTILSRLLGCSHTKRGKRGGSF